MEAYLDNAATTRAADEVAKVVTDIMLNDYGNPSSKHSKGFDAEKIVVGEYCRDGSAEDVLITLHYDISRESSHLESVYLG